MLAAMRYQLMTERISLSKVPYGCGKQLLARRMASGKVVVEATAMRVTNIWLLILMTVFTRVISVPSLEGLQVCSIRRQWWSEDGIL